MQRWIAALLAATSCALSAQAPEWTGLPTQTTIVGLSLDQAIEAAGGGAPAADAATAAITAAEAARNVAGLHPNPIFQGQIENIAGRGVYRGLRSAETTVGVSIPLELGGKRGARIAVADATIARARLQAAIAIADVRLQVTQLYVEAVAAERRATIAVDQERIASEALRAATIRVQAGRASPIEQQRADVARINAEANLARRRRSAEASRLNLARRIGRSIVGTLDLAWLDSLSLSVAGPARPFEADGTLALAAAEADIAVADAGVWLARSQRVPDLVVGPALRRLEQTNDAAAVFSVSIPIPVFNAGRSAVAQATAERSRAEALRRATRLDAEQAITDALVEADNSAMTARAANGPALAAAQEAARIARIGYRDGKFGQLDLLDAERTLAETRVAAIDALAAHRTARARLERLTAPAPDIRGK